MTVWARPIPLIGDTTSAAERATDPTGWAFSAQDQIALNAIIDARRDVRRFRPDDVDDELLEQLLLAAHRAPSVGYSQPWRFIVVRDPETRTKAAWMADRQRLAQAAAMDEQSARQLLDLQLEGIREAPVGVVVCCDRRADPTGVLGRATYPDTDLWSCACAIENLWLAARAAGLGVGWVTLFEPRELAASLDIPDGVETLGWLCIGWPDERQHGPGLERHGWSASRPLSELVMSERWNNSTEPAPPRSRVRGPSNVAVVAARDHADRLLTAPRSLGVLGSAVDRVIACCGAGVDTATLVLAAGDHPVADLGITPYRRSVTSEVLAAARAGESIGVAAASTARIAWKIVDGGSSTGDLVSADALSHRRAAQLVDDGVAIGERLGASGLVALGEVGVGNTTIAAALVAALLGVAADDVVGLGSGANSSMLDQKRAVVDAALERCRRDGRLDEPIDLLRALGGPEFALLCGVTVGAARSGGVVVLDGLATTVAAAIACRIDPAVSAHLIAGQRSNELAHPRLLEHLGLEPLLDLRLRTGEGVGAVMASRLVLDCLETRRRTAVTR